MKAVFIFTLFFSFLFSKSVLEIYSIGNQEIVLKNNQDLLQVGKSGFVISNYLDTEYISAIVEIVSIDKKNIHTKIIQKNPFKKEYLAYAKKDIDKEDIVIFDLFEDDVFLIAPNKDSYFKIKSSMDKNKHFLSPEIAISKLGNYFVDKKDFINLAKEYLIGDIYVAYSNYLVRVDAFSMKVLEKNAFKIDNINKEKKLFYYISDESVFSLLMGKITFFDYDEYYKNLLEG